MANPTIATPVEATAELCGLQTYLRALPSFLDLDSDV